jgi:hypothetical protein
MVLSITSVVAFSLAERKQLQKEDKVPLGSLKIEDLSKAHRRAISRTAHDCAQDLYIAQGIGCASSRSGAGCDAIIEVLPFTAKRFIESRHDRIVRVGRAIHRLHAHV